METRTYLLFFSIALMAVVIAIMLWKNRKKFKRLPRAGTLKMTGINGNKTTGLFDEYFIEPKALFLKLHGTLPCINYIGNIDVIKATTLINAGDFGTIIQRYQRQYYDWQDGKTVLQKNLFVLENKVIVRFGEDWADIYTTHENIETGDKILQAFILLKAPEKEDAYEINIITIEGGSLYLKQLEIKPTSLDVNLYYNDDFEAIDKVIRERLERDNDKGIILLHGLPGTGKTTYLRHLIGNMKKKVLFVSPGVAGNLMNPEFIDLLIDNPNAVLVIEDAENIIMDRRYNSNSSVSNLLNISDGLLSDCLNVQIICTFNSPLHMVDTALLRKGRLIAKYEFGKLDVTKAVALSNHLGLQQEILEPTTLAEIANPGEIKFDIPKTNVIGFRRELIEN